ncbi:MAG: MAPEG family protein [Phenylobacterium sp.]|jgi:uncharacterized MAPEG superfamily protein|uniref:MAPEG family protein n=1 Tax=Phenylobacterium sp. TaxID=1871053 RepID=UPI002A2FCBAA|nr:MAPEG family protein [Phenylobacterium sp.]MDD3838705.1 MAPEG family protein [Phenylobacterium sp.]MDX9999332.1 MAPEG family protein [Phenylobacterium sp.]
MAPELQLLGLAVVVGIVQLGWAAVAARRQQTLAWAAGPRDEPMPITGTAARLDRAFRNFMETFPFFAAAVLSVAAGDRFSDLTLWGSGLYVAGRALYVPIYAAGIPRVRTLVWAVSMVGLLMVVAALFV